MIEAVTGQCLLTRSLDWSVTSGLSGAGVHRPERGGGGNRRVGLRGTNKSTVETLSLKLTNLFCICSV